MAIAAVAASAIYFFIRLLPVIHARNSQKPASPRAGTGQLYTYRSGTKAWPSMAGVLALMSILLREMITSAMTVTR